MEDLEALEVLERAADAEVSRIQGVVQSVRDAQAAFAKEKQDASLHTKPLSLSGRVGLDVGGKTFFTTGAALRAKSGFFHALCDGVGGAELDSESCIFIDRSPVAFRFVLNHLRGQPIDLGLY
jgi:hypothetical protein